MNAIQELPIVIQGSLPTPMLGVLTSPREGLQKSGTGVIIVNGGAQYRAGAHRLFVQLARHLAQQGHAVLRFDLPGQGDSPGEPVNFEDTASHIRCAIDALHQHHSDLQDTALMGLCDGASASLLYLNGAPDARVTHLVLLNPWVHNPVAKARAQVKHYYRQRLLMPDFWGKLASGRVGLPALRELWGQWWLSRQTRNTAATHLSFQDRMAMAWHRFPGKRLLAMSEHDHVAQEFNEHVETSPAWRGWRQCQGLQVTRLSGADHTISTNGSQSELLESVTRFVDKP